MACASTHAGIGCAAVPGTCLMRRLREAGARPGRRGAAVPEALCWRALREVAAGLDFLHAHDVLHLVRARARRALTPGRLPLAPACCPAHPVPDPVGAMLGKAEHWSCRRCPGP
jgi:hypothetical protein